MASEPPAPVDLHYEVSGTGPVVVLLNGLFQRTAKWAPLLPFLEGFCVIRYDMRGQGQSPAPAGIYTPEVHAADLRRLLAKVLPSLGTSQYALVGLSNGGVVGQLFAADPYPGLTKLAVLCSTPVLDAALRAKFDSWQRALDFGGSALRIQVSLPWSFGRGFLEKIADAESASPMPGPDGSAFLAGAVAEARPVAAQTSLLQGLMRMPDLRPRLKNISVPALVVAGEDDLLFPVRYAKVIAASIPASRLITMPDVGHQPPLENPQGTAQILCPFLLS